MTSTLGVWILTGYGAAKAPRLMQFSVHCDHLRSVLFVRAGPSPYGEMVAALTTLFRKKMCASIQKHFSNIRPRKRAKVRRFSKKILKTDLLPYGETWAVLTSVLQTFSSLSAIRRKTCCFDQVFFQNFFCFLHHTEKRMPFC